MAAGFVRVMSGAGAFRPGLPTYPIHGLPTRLPSFKGAGLTIDEELSQLEDSLRRLKVEYDIYFSGGAKKPPTDIDWRVRAIMKKYSDGRRLSYTQRFRYNTLANRYAIFNDLWRQKLKIKEEGYRRPQDAVLSIAGLRDEEAHAEALAHHHHQPKPFSVRCSDPDAELDSIKTLFQVMVEAREKAGAPTSAGFDSFRNFVRQKTNQIRQEHGCPAVEYSVEIDRGQVRLKAKPRRD